MAKSFHADNPVDTFSHVDYYTMSVAYPPKETSSSWEMTVYFNPDNRFQDQCEFAGTYNGVGKVGTKSHIDYLSTQMSHEYNRPEEINTTFYGSEAGKGGYDRVGFRFKFFPTIPQNVNGAYVLIRCWLDCNIRSMEYPTSTRPDWTFEPGFILAPQTDCVGHYESFNDLQPNERRYFTYCFVSHGSLAYDKIRREDYVLVDINWKDKTGVPPDTAWFNARFDVHIIQTTFLIVPVRDPNDSLRDTEEGSVLSWSDLCAPVDVSWAFLDSDVESPGHSRLSLEGSP